LGEKTTKLNYYYVISFTIYGTKNGFYIEYRLYSSTKGDKEYKRVIRKDTAILMLSRLRLTEEQERRISELIPYFEREREKIQLHDRINDQEGLTDEEIQSKINQVQHFSFFGYPVKCHRKYPHPPHQTGVYQTVRYGSLPIYCSGRSGILLLKNGKRVQLLITKSCPEECYGRYRYNCMTD
jgi:hypothetical protein